MVTFSFKLLCIYTTLTLPLVYTIFCINIISCAKTPLSYNDHCYSVVPESRPTSAGSSILPFPPNQEGYYLGGDGIFSHVKNGSDEFYYSSNERKMMVFSTSNIYETNSEDVYNIEASLTLNPPGQNYFFEDVSYSYSLSSQVIAYGSQNGQLTFDFNGFWSKYSGKLCMVGSSSVSSGQDGKTRVFQAVLKLEGVQSSNNITSLVTGTLDALNSDGESEYFKTMSILMFPRENYVYTKVSKDFDFGCADGGGVNDSSSESLVLTISKPICTVFSYTSVVALEYSRGCKDTKSCNIFGESIDDLPQVMALKVARCSQDRRRLGYLLEFTKVSSDAYYLPFEPNKTLIAEGSWDPNKNKLCVVACHVSNSNSFLNGSYVTDCSVRLTLRFPAVWSLGKTSPIVGHIWSTKTASEPGYFDRITFSYERNGIYIAGLKYNYTFVDKAKKDWCLKETPRRKAGKQYPDSTSYDMQFSMRPKNSKENGFSWVYFRPVFVGDQPWERNTFVLSSIDSETEAKTTHTSPQNISYIIEIELTAANASSIQGLVKISAEGTYDPETGHLCMAGCRYNSTSYQKPVEDSMDCEVLVSVQFPPKRSNDLILGSIKSTQEKSSKLYFPPIPISALPYYSAEGSIWRMDLEIIMALVSNTLVCVFVVFQIWHVKKNAKEVYPFISVVMLVVLTMGQMIPLVLNFEALFFPENNKQVFLRRSGGWLEANEVIVRVVTMVAFLLQCRLLQLVCSARLAGENQKPSWVAERRTLYVTFPIYAIGGLIALYVNRKKYGLGEGISTRSRYRRHYAENQRSLLTGLRSYGGLVLDSFLLPQILLNVFQNSNEYALSKIFYMGTTFIRLLPHAYDLYRAHNYFDNYNWTYIYASPDADYFSTAWDVVIPLMGLLFAGIIHTQQRFGGHCILPKRFREKAAYEKVPIADEA